ncbi:hypothetical protein [Mesorhizobium sp. M0571]|uniref:hypothetical protein n=1 Tax=Mesorhizobium sp. M0571 TaxID=2956960 RepID=UPI00333C2B51
MQTIDAPAGAGRRFAFGECRAGEHTLAPDEDERSLPKVVAHLGKIARQLGCRDDPDEHASFIAERPFRDDRNPRAG